MKILIKNIQLIATFNQQMEEIKNGWILIENNIIKNLGTGDPPKDFVYEEIDGKELLIMPGFINVHSHFFQSLFRAIPEIQNANLFNWLSYLYNKWKYIDEEAIYISTIIATLELIKSGVTTTVDHLYVFPYNNNYLIDAELEGIKTTKIRFYGTRGCMSLSKKDGGIAPDSVIQKESDIYEDYERIIKQFHINQKFSMCRFALAPCSLFTVTENIMKETLKFAEKYNLLLHMHLGETKDEYNFCISKFNLKPVDYMDKIGWLNDRVWFAHLVNIDDNDIEKLSKAKVGMAHCPTANMRLGDGIAPVYKMKNTSIKIGIGVDGSASNDTGNFLKEMRNAMLLQRVQYGADAITAKEALLFGIKGGAKILKIDNEVSSIEIGKAADIIGFKLNQLEFAGAISDFISAIIFCDTKQVDLSIINGNIIIKNSNFLNIDEKKYIEKHNSIAKKYLQRL